MLATTLGVLIGLVLGLTGAGGSVLAVPLLVLFLGLSQPESAGLSLGAVAVAALLGGALRLGRGQIAWLPAAFLALFAVLLTPLGQALGGRLPTVVVMSAFMLLVLLIAWRMWRQAVESPALTRVVRASWAGGAARESPACALSPSGHFELGLPCITRMALAGAATGLLSGLFGVGGGFVIVPMLVLLTGLPMVQAVATSLAVISLVSFSGFALFLWQNPVELSLLFPLSGGALAGMVLGTVLSPRLAGPRLQQLFVVLMLLLAALSLRQTLIKI